MEDIFKLEDIHNFLLRCGYPEWDYEVFDRQTGEIRRATIEDFTNNLYNSTELAFYVKKYGDYCGLEVAISSFKFVTYNDTPNIMGSGSTRYEDKNFTEAWAEYLLNKYGADYAKILYNYSQIHKIKIKAQENREILTQVEEIKKKYKLKASPYENLSGLAEQYLDVSEIIKIQEDVANSGV